ncbi:thiamine phosphate synthase [Mesorhizobium sp. CAU 1741]|uniref:thiamine phosphate synthase n=1 Tax=Mesorhizobium sp. CAU 1741 TaxID=3140366 RepID=UPI00325BF83C
MRPRFDLSFYLVLDPALCGDLGMVETARQAATAGATMIQLRDKQADTARLVETGRALKQALAGTDALLVVNDDADAAVAIGADGLHIGQGDLDVALARARTGPDMILGVTVETAALAAALDTAIVDYAGIGPVFATPTKPDHKPPIGFDGLARMVEACPVPAVAIGGLKARHANDVFKAGARGLAVVSAVCGQPDPHAAARDIAGAIKRACR